MGIMGVDDGNRDGDVDGRNDDGGFIIKPPSAPNNEESEGFTLSPSPDGSLFFSDASLLDESSCVPSMTPIIAAKPILTNNTNEIRRFDVRLYHGTSRLGCGG